MIIKGWVDEMYYFAADLAIVLKVYRADGVVESKGKSLVDEKD